MHPEKEDAGSRNAPYSADDVAKLEVGLLGLIFDQHPQHLTVAELIDRMAPVDPRYKDDDQAIEQAIRTLQASGLVSEMDGAIVPTPAALHFDQLPF